MVFVSALLLKLCCKAPPNNCNSGNTENRKIFNVCFAVFIFSLHLELYNFQVSLVLVISGVLCGREEGKSQFHCSLLLKTCK